MALDRAQLRRLNRVRRRSAHRRSRAALFVGLLIVASGCLAPELAQAQLISITSSANLGFGQMFVSNSLGTCVVNPAGARSASGGVTLGSSAGAGSASFTVTGLPLQTYAITLPSSISMSSGGSTLTLNTFTSTPSGAGQLSVLGRQTFTVGGTLRVGASQPPGTYAGTFSVTVTYN